MTNFRAQVVLRTADNIPENFISNQFCIRTTGTDPLLSTPVTAAIKGFYDAINSTCLPVTIASTGHLIKYYELPGTPPNYPILESVWNLTTTPTGVPLPSEVCMALSFQATRQAGFPQARRRGRIFVGPLEVGTNDAGRPSSGAMASISGAAIAFSAAIEAITGHSWCVWSEVDQASSTVTNGWVDNAFDTQRRRGVVTTSRTAFNL